MRRRPDPSKDAEPLFSLDQLGGGSGGGGSSAYPTMSDPPSMRSRGRGPSLERFGSVQAVRVSRLDACTTVSVLCVGREGVLGVYGGCAEKKCVLLCMVWCVLDGGVLCQRSGRVDVCLEQTAVFYLCYRLFDLFFAVVRALCCHFGHKYKDRFNILFL